MDPRPMRPLQSKPAPVPFAAHPAGGGEAGRACPICQCAIVEGERIGPCPSCSANFHEECWNENGGCAVYGCPRAPHTVKDDAAAVVPQSYWGQENKECPN